MIGPAAAFLETPVGEHLPDLVREAFEAAAGEPLAEDPVSDATGRFGAYRILREIGRGGMGTVYEADRSDRRYDRRVAIKTVPFAVPGGLLARRFDAERRILAGLEHPNIARLYDAGETPEGVPYIAMELVEGRRIDVYCREEGLTMERRLALFDAVCEAVEYAHSKLVAHRDIKPGNILVTEDGTPKLLDFGVARLLDPPGGPAEVPAALTTGLRAMTPEYASPEQLRGEPATTSADVYALGVLLYVLLTGRHPYQPANRTPAEVERTIREAPARPPSEVVGAEDAAGRRRLRGDLDNIVLTAIRAESELRYGSVGDLRRDLRDHLAGLPVAARPATWRYRAAKFVRRHRAGIAAAALVFVSLAGGLAGTAWQARAAALQAERAERTRDYLIGLFETFDPDAAGIGPVTAEQLLDRGAERLAVDLGDQPATQAELGGVLGRLYQRMGLYDKARPLLTTARERLIASRGERHPETAAATARLASLLHAEGKYDEAEPLARSALDARRRAFGDADTAVANSLTDLGAIRSGLGHWDETEALYAEALAIDRKSGSPEQIATDLDNLGVVHMRLGEYDEARRLNR